MNKILINRGKYINEMRRKKPQVPKELLIGVDKETLMKPDLFRELDAMIMHYVKKWEKEGSLRDYYSFYSYLILDENNTFKGVLCRQGGGKGDLICKEKFLYPGTTLYNIIGIEDYNRIYLDSLLIRYHFPFLLFTSPLYI